MNKEIKGYEYIHGTHTSAPNTLDDLIVVKEKIHYTDGTYAPNVRLIENFERPFWVTLDKYRNHKDKKVWEQKNRLREFSSTQRRLKDAVSRALKKPGSDLGLRQLARSPYLYGIDIPVTSLVKKRYMDKYPDCISPSKTVAVLDIETDVVKGTNDIICITLSFKDKVVVAITKEFIGTIPDPINKLHLAATKHLKELIESRKMNIEFRILDNSALCCAHVFKRANEWKPDFIAIWNMNYDLPRIKKAVEAYGLRMEDLVSDEKVPVEFRKYNYVEGPAQKITSSGDVSTLAPYERWHVVYSTSSYFFVDAMCVYYRIRLGDGKVVGGYGLDNTLKNHGLGGKLKLVPEVDNNYVKLRWHFEMQNRFKLEYILYNIYDCVGMELLDEKTGDIRSTMPLLCEVSDLGRFKSNPRKLADDMHFECLSHGYVIASFSDNFITEDDKAVGGADGITVTLAAHQIDDNGLELFDELPGVRSNLRLGVSDLDIEGTYPRIQEKMNIAQDTTRKELVSVEGYIQHQFRMIGIDITGGSTNAWEIASKVMGFPDPIQLLDAFMQDHS